MLQPIPSVAKGIVSLFISATFSAGEVNGGLPHDVSLEYTPNGAGLHALAFEEETPLTSEVLPDCRGDTFLCICIILWATFKKNTSFWPGLRWPNYVVFEIQSKKT